ncbi:MAG: hypothetical protein ABR981_03665 [Candidatus Micrarchaeaceae archaeon]|jgi:hypothetical protein
MHQHRNPQNRTPVEGAEKDPIGRALERQIQRTKDGNSILKSNGIPRLGPKSHEDQKSTQTNESDAPKKHYKIAANSGQFHELKNLAESHAKIYVTTKTQFGYEDSQYYYLIDVNEECIKVSAENSDKTENIYFVDRGLAILKISAVNGTETNLVYYNEYVEGFGTSLWHEIKEDTSSYERIVRFERKGTIIG